MKMKKVLAMMLAVVLIVTATVAGTVAWLTTSTQEVKNTFTTSDIDITLAETTGEEYKMVPGATIDKDPKVTVVAGSEDCYLFVEVTEACPVDGKGFADYLDYEIASGWEKLDGVNNVYYRQVAANATDREFSVLANDEVSVLSTVTKEMMEAAKGKEPTLTFKAYAVQSANLTDQNTDGNVDAKDAWALCPTA